MNKALVTAAIVGTALISPVAGMGIGETRSLLLNLAPDDAIMKVADQIDTNKIDSETKIAELQSTIDAQQAKLAEQQKLIDEQKTVVEKTKADVETTNATLTKTSTCAADLAKYSATCGSVRSTYDQSLSDYMKWYKKTYTNPTYTPDKDDLAGAEKNYGICKDLYSRC